jgi:hypothetical protein
MPRGRGWGEMTDEQERKHAWEFERFCGLLKEQNRELKRIADRLERMDRRPSFSVWDAAVTIALLVYFYSVLA